LVIVYFDFTISGKIEKVKGELERTTSEVQRLKAVTAKVAKFQRDKKVLEKKLEVIEKLSEGRKGHVYLLDELSSVVPDKLWIETLKESGLRLKMAGLALDHDTIADFMMNMERSAMFKNIHLKVTQQTKKADINVQKFTIDATFVPPKREE